MRAKQLRLSKAINIVITGSSRTTKFYIVVTAAVYAGRIHKQSENSAKLSTNGGLMGSEDAGVIGL